MKEKARKTKKQLKGVVLKVIDDSTAKVEVETKTAHPLYKKILKSHKRYLVEINGKQISEGDEVTIEETTPISKNKKFKLVEVASK